jgi:hypothetical protein
VNYYIAEFATDLSQQLFNLAIGGCLVQPFPSESLSGRKQEFPTLLVLPDLEDFISTII